MRGPRPVPEAGSVGRGSCDPQAPQGTAPRSLGRLCWSAAGDHTHTPPLHLSSPPLLPENHPAWFSPEAPPGSRPHAACRQTQGQPAAGGLAFHLRGLAWLYMTEYVPQSSNLSPTCSGHWPTSDPASLPWSFLSLRYSETGRNPQAFLQSISGLHSGVNLRAGGQGQRQGSRLCFWETSSHHAQSNWMERHKGRPSGEHPASSPCCPLGARRGLHTRMCAPSWEAQGVCGSGEHPSGPTGRHQALHWGQVPLTDWILRLTGWARVTGEPPPWGLSWADPPCWPQGPQGRTPGSPRGGTATGGALQSRQTSGPLRSHASLHNPDSWEDGPAGREDPPSHGSSAWGHRGPSRAAPGSGTLRTNCSPPPRRTTSLHLSLRFYGLEKKFV